MAEKNNTNRTTEERPTSPPPDVSPPIRGQVLFSSTVNKSRDQMPAALGAEAALTSGQASPDVLVPITSQGNGLPFQQTLIQKLHQRCNAEGGNNAKISALLLADCTDYRKNCLTGHLSPSAEPTPAHRSRGNTIPAPMPSNNFIELQNKETLQPVKFGDCPQLNVETQNIQKLSPNDIAADEADCESLSGLGRCTTSSNSLHSQHSEYCCDSIASCGVAESEAIASNAPTTGGDRVPSAVKALIPSLVPLTSCEPSSGNRYLKESTDEYPSVNMLSSAPYHHPLKTKRQKRLERNRESARASRRRRKQYLEELELNVSNLSLEMDRGRLNHACMAVRTVKGMRLGALRELERRMVGTSRGSASGASMKHAAATSSGAKPFRPGISHNVTSRSITSLPNQPKESKLHQPQTSDLKSIPKDSLDQRSSCLIAGGPLSPLSRTSVELEIVQIFLNRQLLSLVQPTASRLVLWLSLQKDGFYRSGRSTSERLSAARIGERLLHSGTLQAAPLKMWPLVCHEIGLSYDQEERIRQTQRSVLVKTELWIHRHTAIATKNVLESVHRVIGASFELAKQRGIKITNILTEEQQVKFLAWASYQKDSIRRLAAEMFETLANKQKEEYNTSVDKCVTSNMYIVDHRLKVNQPPPFESVPDLVHHLKLKKLSRRPSFESLAGQQSESDCKGSKQLNHDTSYPSTGSLKRSLNDEVRRESCLDPVTTFMNNSAPSGASPDIAFEAGQSEAMVKLNSILSILPKAVLHYTCPNPTPNGAAYPPQAMQSQLKAFRPGDKIRVPKPLSPQKIAATGEVVPHLNDASVEIPMPTPVSVLLQTADDFIASAFEEPLEAEMKGGYSISETFSSCLAATNATGSLLNNRHQSAPQLYSSSLSGHSPSPDLSHGFPTAPMAMIPESSLCQADNIRAGGADDFIGIEMEDLEMETNDWAVGEGFDM